MNYKQKHFKTSRKQYWMAYCYIKQLEKEPRPEKKKNRKKEYEKRDSSNLVLDKAAPL